MLDDEISAITNFLPFTLDNAEMDFKMFRDEPYAALEYVGKSGADVAILDVNMPKIDGITLAEKMIKVSKDIKIIILTGYAQDEDGIKRRLGDNFLGILYKPYDGNSLNALLNKIPTEPKIFIRAFDAFDLFVNGIAVRFSSSKAKELLALLTDANGSFVTLDHAVTCLWPNKNAENGRRLYRDAVCRLRATLKSLNIEKLVRFEYGQAAIDTSAAECDYWNMLKSGEKNSGRYMPQYEWSINEDFN